MPNNKVEEAGARFMRMRETKPANIGEFLDRLTIVEQEFLWEHIEAVKKLDRKENQKEQKPTEWSEDSVKYKEGFKAGRESGLRDGQKYVLNNLDSYGLCKPAEWSEEDEKMLRTIISDGSRSVELDSKQISWLKSLRRFWNPSAQELGALKTAVSVLTEERTFPKAAEQIQKIIDVFDGKELRKDWKPSEDQMNALYNVINPCDHVDKKALESLYKQLEKLI